MNYDKAYYESGNYSSYLSRKDRYTKTAEELIKLCKELSILDYQSNIVDIGCAVGFLIQGFIRNNFHRIEGIEVSDWAIEQCKAKGIDVFHFSSIPPLDEDTIIDLAIALDVFEHMKDADIQKILDIYKPNNLIVRIPYTSVDGGKFVLDISENDKTHINRKTKESWREFIKTKGGFSNSFDLNLNTIYNGSGVFCALFSKENKK